MTSDVDNGGGDACIGAGSIWEISVPSSRFYYTPKIALKKKNSLQKEMSKQNKKKQKQRKTSTARQRCSLKVSSSGL